MASTSDHVSRLEWNRRWKRKLATVYPPGAEKRGPLPLTSTKEECELLEKISAASSLSRMEQFGQFAKFRRTLPSTRRESSLPAICKKNGKVSSSGNGKILH